MHYTTFALTTLLVLAGCADDEPAPTEAEIVEPSVDGKADRDGRAAEVVGALTLDEEITGTVPAKTYHGYTLSGVAGQSLEIELAADRWSILYVYGPLDASEAWGAPISKTTTRGDGEGIHRARATLEVACAGTWLVVVGAVFEKSVDVELLARCTEGCEAQPEPETLCDGETGLRHPLPTCSADAPCTRPAFGEDPITEPSPKPDCHTSKEGREVFDDGAPLAREGIDGTPRYACHHRAEGDEPRPLVVFFHGAGGAADDVYNGTSLRAKAESWPLAGEGRAAGFHLLSVQGRALHYPTVIDKDMTHHDNFYRDLEAPSTNHDFALADTLIDELVAAGDVDPARIYTMGWSNGGHMAQMYAIARHDRTTPGGSRVAATAVFSTGDPFDDIHLEEPSPVACAMDPYPRSEVPLFFVSRACDIMACTTAQAEHLEAEYGLDAEPGHDVEEWMEALATKVGNSNVERLIVKANGTITERCTAPRWCPKAVAILNHIRWPDGVADDSGIDHEPAMLTFLADHPR